MSCFTFGVELTFDNHLRCDAGMIGTRLPERVVAFHSVVARQGIHNGVLKCMTHMQPAGHVRRRNHDAIGITLTRGFKATGGLPSFVDGLLYGFRVVGFAEFGRIVHERQGLVTDCYAGSITP